MTVSKERAMQMFDRDLKILMDDLRGMQAHYNIAEWEAFVFLRKPECPESYVVKYAAADDGFAKQIVRLHAAPAPPTQPEGEQETRPITFDWKTWEAQAIKFCDAECYAPSPQPSPTEWDILALLQDRNRVAAPSSGATAAPDDQEVDYFDPVPLLEKAMRTAMVIECDCPRKSGACDGECVGSRIWNLIHRARKLIKGVAPVVATGDDETKPEE